MSDKAKYNSTTYNKNGATLSPLDVEGPKPSLSSSPSASAHDAALDKKIDKHLLPCLCVISIANYLGARERE